VRILALFAHPDDETFGPGGTLARAAAEGALVGLICATRGEAGTIGESASLGRERLAAVREQELRAAAKVLGLEPPEILDLPDSGLAALPEDDLLLPFTAAVRRFRPHLMVTFHPNGVSGHTDHRTVTARATRVFDLAADPGYRPDLGPAHAADRLWGYCIPTSVAERITYREIFSVPDDEVDALVDTRAWIAVKRAAVAAHATQREFVDRLEAFLGGMEAMWSEEAFCLLASRAPLPGDPVPVRDLFAGMPRPD